MSRTEVLGGNQSRSTEMKCTTDGGDVGGEREKTFSYVIALKNVRLSFHTKTMTLFCGVHDLCLRGCDAALRPGWGRRQCVPKALEIPGEGHSKVGCGKFINLSSKITK